MKNIECNNKRELAACIANECEKRKYMINAYLEQLIACWLRETPPYRYQLFYENEGTELEYADLEIVGKVDLASEISMEDYFALYDGREIPSIHVPNGWEFPSISEDVHDIIDELIKNIAETYIIHNVLSNYDKDNICALQNQYFIYLDEYTEEEAGEAIYMELKESLQVISNEIFLSFLETRKTCPLRELMERNQRLDEFKI